MLIVGMTMNKFIDQYTGFKRLRKRDRQGMYEVWLETDYLSKEAVYIGTSAYDAAV